MDKGMAGQRPACGSEMGREGINPDWPAEYWKFKTENRKLAEMADG